MQKFPEVPDRKLELHMPKESTVPKQKEKFDLTSASTIAQNKLSFLEPLAANTWLIRFSSLIPCLLLVKWHCQNQQYKNTDFGHINHWKKTSAFQCLIWEKRLYSNSPRKYSQLQSSCMKAPPKVEIQKVSPIFVSFFLPLQLSQTRRCQQINTR